MGDNYSFCPECGNKVEGKNKFCNKCGAELKLSILQTHTKKENLKNDTKRNIIIGLIITIFLAIGFSLFNYKTIFSVYYFSQANKAPSFEKKAGFLKNSMKYKSSDANSRAFTNLILSESKINPVKAQNTLLLTKDLLDADVFKILYVDVVSDKATTLIIDHKYKEAAEAYATCGKYDISIVNNSDYINVLGKYAESDLVKKLNLNGDDTPNYYTVGDIDKDGLLEIAVFEKNFSLFSGVYTPNNIKIFRYVSDKYSLVSTVQSDAEYCINIKIAKAKDDINGIFVSGGIGVHSGTQSLYIIKGGKLVSVLDKNIVSLYPSEIKDIDGDKTLELSSLVTDPNDQYSSNAESDKI